MKVLITGGAGYIGSVTAKALESAGHTPIILDSLEIGPRVFVRHRIFYQGDIADRGLLRRIVDDHPDLGATIHMAARVVVPESVAEPYGYYDNNVARSLVLFDELTRLGKPRVLFSSSASLYAPTETFEVTEESPLAPQSPYARTKAMMESILIDLAAATELRTIILRYFNPIGSDPDLESGVYNREPTHVVPILARVALGQLPEFIITGTDYPTADGTGIRDYIHVWDLARAHVRAVEDFDRVLAELDATSTVINIGTGSGVTIGELVRTVVQVSGSSIPTRTAPPRPGDAVGAYAAVAKAGQVLGWKAELGLADGIASVLAWMRKRPEILGYP